MVIRQNFAYASKNKFGGKNLEVILLAAQRVTDRITADAQIPGKQVIVDYLFVFVGGVFICSEI